LSHPYVIKAKISEGDKADGNNETNQSGQKPGKFVSSNGGSLLGENKDIIKVPCQKLPPFTYQTPRSIAHTYQKENEMSSIIFINPSGTTLTMLPYESSTEVNIYYCPFSYRTKCKQNPYQREKITGVKLSYSIEIRSNILLKNKENWGIRIYKGERIPPKLYPSLDLILS